MKWIIAFKYRSADNIQFPIYFDFEITQFKLGKKSIRLFVPSNFLKTIKQRKSILYTLKIRKLGKVILKVRTKYGTTKRVHAAV